MSETRSPGGQHQNGDLDGQISRLAGTLSEKGVTPERDLWPDIDKALDQVDQVVQMAPLPRSRTKPAVWQMAGLAASLLLMVGLGYMGQRPNSDLNSVADNALESVEVAAISDSEPKGPSTLERLDQTLRDLNQALLTDPENRSLTRLVLLVHKSRANIMRQSSSGLNI